MQRSEKMNLTASARLIMQLGEQLIEDELVALLELIKNAYDADGNNVSVVIDTEKDTPYGKGIIEIVDDGNGMIPSIVRNSFLRLSTSFKEEEKSSIHYKRRVLGKKGIGRLSFQRLGNYITVETVPDIERYRQSDLIKLEDEEFIDKYNRINIRIDWSDFPIDMDFSDIVADVEFQKDQSAVFGTRIIIMGIKNLNFWIMDKKKEEKLKNELLNMLDPFQNSALEGQDKKGSFYVELVINGSSYSVTHIDEGILNELYDSKVTFFFNDWRLKIKIERPLKYVMQRRANKIDDMEKAKFEVLHEGKYEKEEEYYELDLGNPRKIHSDYPRLSYNLEKIDFLSSAKLKKLQQKKEEGKISSEDYRKEILSQYAYPGEFEGCIYARDLSNKEGLDIILQKQGLINARLNTLRDINRMWSAMQGVYVYRNGFRVLPYGRKDWIGFTTKSQTYASNIYKEHTAIGYIKLDGFTSEKLEEQTNRQGFIQDEYGKNFFVLIQDILLNMIVDSDVSFREGFTREQENKDNIITLNKKITFQKIIDYETAKNEKMVDVKTELENLRYSLMTQMSDSVESRKAASVLVEKIHQYEEAEQKAIDEKKQDIYLKERQIQEIKDIVPLLGLGIIAESLTHEIKRIQQNIGEYARDTIKNKSDTQKITRNQRNIITQINFLKIQLAHMESTYRKNLEKQEILSVKGFFNEMYVDEESPMARKAYRDNIAVLVEGENISIKANKGILTTIFDNIFLNSLYWAQYSEGEKYIKFVVYGNGCIECYDSGCGVHNRIEENLFEPFQYMKANGRGLGLFIVKELTENMDGRVWLSEDRRNGRRYKFMFDFGERMEENCRILYKC